MSETKHTAGPWTAVNADLHGDSDDPDTTRWAVCTDSQPQYFIATVENGAPGDTLDTEGANARLIAAAPDLYEAAKCARSVLLSANIAGSSYAPVIQKLNAALKLVEGESQ